MNIRKFLLTLAPDFCWCTAFDLLLMAEQIDEDVNTESFSVILSDLKRRGRFYYKSGPPTGKRGYNPGLYLRRKSALDFPSLKK